MAKVTKPSTVTRGTWLDRESMNDLTPRSNLPGEPYRSDTPGPKKRYARGNPSVNAAVKRGAIRKD